MLLLGSDKDAMFSSYGNLKLVFLKAGQNHRDVIFLQINFETESVKGASENVQ